MDSIDITRTVHSFLRRTKLMPLVLKEIYKNLLCLFYLGNLMCF